MCTDNVPPTSNLEAPPLLKILFPSLEDSETPGGWWSRQRTYERIEQLVCEWAIRKETVVILESILSLEFLSQSPWQQHPRQSNNSARVRGGATACELSAPHSALNNFFGEIAEGGTDKRVQQPAANTVTAAFIIPG